MKKYEETPLRAQASPLKLNRKWHKLATQFIIIIVTLLIQRSAEYQLLAGRLQRTEGFLDYCVVVVT